MMNADLPGKSLIYALCLWVQGNVPYGIEYVRNLRKMVGRHLPCDHEFVCFTDRPDEVLKEGISAIEIENIFPDRAWWNKVQLFRRGHFPPGSRLLYLDLDVFVVGDLTEIIDYPEDFALIPHAGNFKGRDGLRVVPKYNSSCMVWNADHRARIWENFAGQHDRPVTEFWGDQDWIGHLCPNENTFPLSWFPRISELRDRTFFVKGHAFPDDAPFKVVLCKKPKNHIAVQEWPWLRPYWEGRV